jgi:hypothetical protein
LAETEKMVWCERWENDFVIDCFMIDEKIPLFFLKKKVLPPLYQVMRSAFPISCKSVFFQKYILKLFLYFLKIIFYICKLKQFKK